MIFSGILIATVSKPAVTISGTIGFLSNIIVNGPGQNAFINLYSNSVIFLAILSNFPLEHLIIFTFFFSFCWIYVIIYLRGDIMATRKSMTLPVVLTIIIISIMVYLFTIIKQTEVVCDKTTSYDADVKVIEDVVVTLDGKEITNLNVSKKIVLPDKYNNESTINGIKYSLENTLNYLGNRVEYTNTDYGLLVNIKIDDNKLVLLDNISFYENDSLEIKVESNTKNSNIVVLSVGDNYTDGELMKRLKNTKIRSIIVLVILFVYMKEILCFGSMNLLKNSISVTP